MFFNVINKLKINNEFKIKLDSGLRRVVGVKLPFCKVAV